MSDAVRAPPPEIPDLVGEVESRTYKVLPFGLDKTVNMRDLDPAGTVTLNRQWKYQDVDC